MQALCIYNKYIECYSVGKINIVAKMFRIREHSQAILFFGGGDDFRRKKYFCDVTRARALIAANSFPK